MTRLLCFLTLVFVVGASALDAKEPSQLEKGFESIFDGKSFKGWEGNMKWFRIEDGEFFDWNTSREAISGAVPEVSFHEVVFVEGTNINSSNSPLGLGAHPVNTAFDMGWKV